MADASRFPHPPDGLVLCGGEGWDRMDDDAREEIWAMDEYLRDGGKRTHPEGFKAWHAARRSRASTEGERES